VLDWLQSLWAMVDERLREVSEKLQKVVRLIRVLVVFLTIGVLLVLASAVVGLLWPRWFPVAYAIATVFLVIPLIALLVLAYLPLRAKSVIRLIDKGYPGNARELAIRVAARKLRDQSIETEELLVETAVNETRKVVERAKAKAAAARAEQEAEEAAARARQAQGEGSVDFGKAGAGQGDPGGLP
jgi:Na+/phosphate symporter